MAAVETFSKNAVSMKLDAGTTSSGTTKTVNLSIGTLSTNDNDFNLSKVWNIVALIVPCLEYDLYSVTRTRTSTITDEE